MGRIVPSPEDILRKTGYFADLTLPQLTEISRALIRRTYEKGESVITEGEPCEGLYVVESGRLRVHRTSSDGREQVLLVAGPGQTFNEVPVFDGDPNPASVDALEAAVVLMLPKESLLSMLERQPALSRVFMRVFAAHLRHLAALVEDLSFRTVVGRLARLLLRQASLLGGSRGEEKPSGRRVTQRELAAMVGTSREVIGRALKVLERQGAIQVRGGRVTLLDVGKLGEIGR